jgi:hypothetical protein
VEVVTDFIDYHDPLHDEREEQRAAAMHDAGAWDDDRPTADELADDGHLVAAAITTEQDVADFMPRLTITADQVTYVAELALVPMPERDVHWFHVRIRPGRAGWAYVNRVHERPTPADVAAELNDLQARIGANVVEGRMLGGGMELRAG